jgi:phospholipase C
VLTRRAFLAGAVGLVAAGPGLSWAHTTRAAGSRALAAAPQPPIDHVVVCMMENRSFDHFLGWLPGADGKQDGLTYADASGVPHSTYHLTDFQGCGHPDPDHSWAGGRVEYDGGACDGWLRAGQNDVYAIGYYARFDLPFLGNAATDWTTCDRYFAAIMAETYPNRFYQHAGVTDRLSNTSTISTLPTIWDRVAAKGLRGRYYYSDVPFLALWGSKYVSIGRSYAQFLADCATGALPEVAFVDPRFLGEEQGTSGDDHPHGDIRAGESFLYQTYRAVTTSPAWSRTVLVINFDEWGGFFDHVPPSEAADVDPSYRLRGFRTPAVVISPFARRRFVGHNVYDHTSVLKLIEWRWNLQPLSIRDRTARNLAEVLDFSAPNATAPDYQVPPFVSGSACTASAPSAGPELSDLAPLAAGYGWPIYG